MPNPLVLIGGGVVLLGALLVLSGILGAVRAVYRRHVYRRKPLAVEGEGIYSGALPAKAVYVPGTIGRKLGLVVVGVVVAAIGAPVLFCGMELATRWVAVAEPALLARVENDNWFVHIETAHGEKTFGQLVGKIVVAHGEFIEFRGPLAQIGLTTYARLEHLGGYVDSAAALGHNAGGSRVDLPPSPLFGWMKLVEKQVPDWIETSRRTSGSLAGSTKKAELWATVEPPAGSGARAAPPAGLQWRS